jgi:hypothetical protein
MSSVSIEIDFYETCSESIKTKCVKTMILYIQRWLNLSIQTTLLHHIYTCSNSRASAGSTSETYFLEFPTGILMHHIKLFPHQTVMSSAQTLSHMTKL